MELSWTGCVAKVRSRVWLWSFCVFASPGGLHGAVSQPSGLLGQTSKLEGNLRSKKMGEVNHDTLLESWDFQSPSICSESSISTAEGGSDLILTKGNGSGSLGVVGAIGVSGSFSPPSISKELLGLKFNFSERRGLWGTEADKISSAVTTTLSLFRNRFCATRMMTSNGDRGYG